MVGTISSPGSVLMAFIFIILKIVESRTEVQLVNGGCGLPHCLKYTRASVVRCLPFIFSYIVFFCYA